MNLPFTPFPTNLAVRATSPRASTRRLMIHCTATPEGRDNTIRDVWSWHVNGNPHRWAHVGYHWCIRLDGTIEQARPETHVGAGASGHNADTVHVAYYGGVDSRMRVKDTRTPAQWDTLRKLVADIMQRYSIPRAGLIGHNEVAAKGCPSFNVQAQDWTPPNIPSDPPEIGNPEPNLPDLGTVGEALINHEQRLKAIEKWIASGGKILNS